MASFREGGNIIANTSFNGDQMSEVLEGKANKVFLDKNLNNN